MFSNDYVPTQATWAPDQVSFDPRNSVQTGWAQGAAVPTPTPQGTNVPSMCGDVQCINAKSWGYDNDGRQHIMTWQYAYKPPGKNSQNQQETGTQNRNYDAENLFKQQTNSNWGYNIFCPSKITQLVNVTQNYTFDARQRIVVDQMSSDFAGSYTETIHWDDDRPLFTTNAAGHVDDIFVGSFADIYPQQSPTIDFWDRDWSDNVVSVHNSSGNGEWVLPSPRHGQCDTKMLAEAGNSYTGPLPQSAGNVNGPGGIIVDASSDGLFDGWNTFQGVRVYDSDLGHWTAPDALKGTIEDPASQKSYMWNHNNPVSYSDPTGYQGVLEGAEEACAQECAPAENVAISIAQSAWGGATTAGRTIASTGIQLSVRIWNALGSAGEKVINVTNSRLSNAVNNLFRTSDKMAGGTAGAVRYTAITGKLVGGSDHIEKAEQQIVNLTRIESQENLTTAEKALVKALVDDLKSSVQFAKSSQQSGGSPLFFDAQTGAPR